MTKTSAVPHSGARPGTTSPSPGSWRVSKLSLNSSICGYKDCEILYFFKNFCSASKHLLKNKLNLKKKFKK